VWIRRGRQVGDGGEADQLGLAGRRDPALLARNRPPLAGLPPALFGAPEEVGGAWGRAEPANRSGSPYTVGRGIRIGSSISRYTLPDGPSPGHRASPGR
jgi:hypothetical protein